MKVKISKEMFCRLMVALKTEYRLTEDLNEVFRHYQYDTRILSTNLIDAVVDMLEDVFNDKVANWIQYWMFELEFGDSYKEGCITKDGEVVPMKTAEDLYDFLMYELEDD